MRRTTLSVLTVAALAACPLNVATAAHSKYRLGTYRGTTSQGNPFSVVIYQVEARYLLDMRDNGMKVSEPCAAGYANAIYMNVGPLNISPTGHVRSRTDSDGDVEVVHFTVKHDGTLSGTVSETSASDDCASGAVRFTAKRR